MLRTVAIRGRCSYRLIAYRSRTLPFIYKVLVPRVPYSRPLSVAPSVPRRLRYSLLLYRRLLSSRVLCDRLRYSTTLYSNLLYSTVFCYSLP